MSSDLILGFGAYDERTYTEITLGQNWFFSKQWNWRNAAFVRFGDDINSLGGLDSTLRFHEWLRLFFDPKNLNSYVGAGLRGATQNHSGGILETGLGIPVGKFYFGIGFKFVGSFSERKDKYGVKLPSSDAQTSLLIGFSP